MQHYFSCCAQKKYRSALEFWKSIMRLKINRHSSWWKSKLSCQAWSWMMMERIPHPPWGLSVFFSPPTPLFLRSTVPSHSYRDRTVCVPSLPRTQQHHTKERVVMQKEISRTNDENMAKQWRATPAFRLNGTGLSVSSVLVTHLRIVLRGLKSYRHSEVGRSTNDLTPHFHLAMCGKTSRDHSFLRCSQSHPMCLRNSRL